MRSIFRPPWLAILAAVLSGCAANPVPIEPSMPDAHSTVYPDAHSTVYVVGRGWHTDIGFAVEEISGPLAALERGLPGVTFLTFGFGERQFLLRHETTFLGMLSALLPSRSAVLMTALRATPQAAFGADHVIALQVSRAGLQRIETLVWQELEKTSGGEPVVLAAGPYPGSIFYAGRETYDGLFTCNSWTVTMLHAGGLAVATTGVVFESQVMQSVRTVAGESGSVRHD